MASRRQSIRTRIILLLAAPFAALLGLWVLAASFNLGDALLLMKARAFQTKIVLPTQALVTGLQDERRLSLAYLGSGAVVDHTALERQRAETDQLRLAYRSGASLPDLRGGIQPGVVAKVDALSARLGDIDSLRQAIDGNVVSRPLVLAEYGSFIDAAFAIYYAVSPGNAEISLQVRTLTSLARARELLAREDALLTGALAKGQLTATERAELAGLVGAQRFQYQDTVPLLSAADQKRFRHIEEGADLVRFRDLEDAVLRTPSTPHGDRLPVTAAVWDSSARTVVRQFYGFENQVLATVADRAEKIAIGVLLRLALTAGLGLIAVIFSVIFAVRAGRKIVREARTLAGAVQVFSRDQLPVLAERVRRGELIGEGESVTAELDFSVTEIDKLSEAFDAASRAVLRAARSEAAARNGVSDLFVNLARRNQALLHRQLGLLDNMERRVVDPLELAELFQLDHLATCMRRHAEGLVILAGKNAGRSWRTPVPIIDVARGAVAEVEDYTRVQVLPMPRAALAGSAAADTIHLLAELIENAAMFSPPDAPVQVSGELVQKGFVIEVEDRGLGMSPALLRELNGKLATAPELDLLDSARLGMFVIAQLAARHDIKVSLRPSPYGGSTAIVLIPDALIVTDLPGAMPATQRAATTAPAIGPVAVPRRSEPADTADLSADKTAPAWHSRTGQAERRTAPQAGVEPEPKPAPPSTPSLLGAAFRTSAPADPDDTHAGLPRRRRAAVTPTPAPETRPGPVPLSAPAATAEPKPVPAQPSADGADGADRHLDLPRRRRQASLAPQLREASPEPAPEPFAQPGGEPARDPAGEPAPARSPENARSMMAAMQRGWQRGRERAEPTERIEPTDPTERTGRTGRTEPTQPSPGAGRSAVQHQEET